MALSIDIVTLHDTLDMYGEPDPSSAYSLSGHVSIIITPTRSPKPVRFLLKSLMLTFEGQTELVSPFSGYVPLRLCTLTRELAPSEPFEISNEGHEDDRQPIKWNVVFNLTVPGWLPATSTFGEANGGTRYTLYASAEFVNLGEKSCGSKFSFFSGLCSSFFSRARTIDARSREVIVKRYIKPASQSVSSTPQPLLTYAINSDPASLANTSSSNPSHLPSIKFSMLAWTPEYVDVNDSEIPLSMHLRAEGLDGAEYTDMQISSFGVEVEQREDYRSYVPSSSASKFPLPPRNEQPPNIPLINPNAIMVIYELGYVPANSLKSKFSRFISLQHPNEPFHYVLGQDAPQTAPEEDTVERPLMWHTLKTKIPFSRSGLDRTSEEDRWGGVPCLRPDTQSPLLDVSHSLHVAVTCTYIVSDPNSSASKRATERLMFTLPLHLVEFTPAPLPPSPSLTASSSSLSSDERELSGSTLVTRQSTPSLPPYSQLYESDGQRKIDWDIPLPLYEPPSDSPPLLLLDLDLAPKQLNLLESSWPPLASRRL